MRATVTQDTFSVSSLQDLLLVVVVDALKMAHCTSFRELNEHVAM